MENRQDYIARVQVAVSQLYNCGAVSRSTVPVHEVLEWKLILGSVVASFLISCAAPPQQSGNSTSQKDPKVNHYPNYPAIAAENGCQGEVILRVVVGSDLRASSVEVARSAGHKVLDDAAKESVSNWTFRLDEIGTNNVKIKFTLSN